MNNQLAVGGLAGDNYGTIANSYATGAVSNTDTFGTAGYLGGLVGNNDGPGISNSYATGSVSNSSANFGDLGGLVGYNQDNVPITNSYATGTVNDGTGQDGFIGGLVGDNNLEIITDDYATGAVTAGSTNAAGGLVGANFGAISISFATGSVANAALGGGLTGENGNGGTIVNSFAMGAVTSGAANAEIGGLVGANVGSIKTSYATGSVAGTGTTPQTGGFVGNNSGTIGHSYWDTQTSGQSAGVGQDTNNQTGNFAGLTTAQLTAALPAGFSSTVWGNVNNQTTPYLIANPSPVYIGSDGTDLFTLIFTMGQLQAINANLTGNYALATSLNAATDPSTPASWIPIGTNGAGYNFGTGFTGIFDGLGNTISNLTVNIGSSQYAGLFGYVEGTLRNVGLIGGSVTGGYDTGSLAGFDSGTITATFATTTVTGTGNVGGLVGRGYFILNSFANGAVTGGDDTGGLVGFDGGSIQSSYATGSVHGANDVGGLVGDLTNGVTVIMGTSYATGAVSGSNFVGGLAGAAMNANIYNSYATGAITGTGTFGGIGGLVGWEMPAANTNYISGSYWDTSTTGVTAAVGTGTATLTNVSGLTTAQLSATLPTGFSSLVWGNVNNQTTPYLLTNPGPVYIGSDSTHLYTLIVNMAELQAINANLKGDYALATSINAATDPTTPANWIPLGTDGAGNVENSAQGFSGIFNGLGNTISNFTFTTSASYAGLFGNSSGTISNIGLINAAVSSNYQSQGSSYAGGLAAVSSGSIANSYVTGSVTGQFSVGGLVGQEATGAISNSYSTATVSGGNRVGGDVALGGLVGTDYGPITNSYATGAVSGGSGAQDVGGLVGYDRGSVANSYATGAVSTSGSGGDVGGLTGYGYGTVSDSYATGAVSGTGGFVGGLVGFEQTSIENSYATGSVSSSGNGADYLIAVGGLVGQSLGVIANSYAMGAVSNNATLNPGGNRVGGLVGFNDTGSISDSYATGDVQSDPHEHQREFVGRPRRIEQQRNDQRQLLGHANGRAARRNRFRQQQSVGQRHRSHHGGAAGHVADWLQQYCLGHRHRISSRISCGNSRRGRRNRCPALSRTTVRPWSAKPFTSRLQERTRRSRRHRPLPTAITTTS